MMEILNRDRAVQFKSKDYTEVYPIYDNHHNGKLELIDDQCRCNLF